MEEEIYHKMYLALFQSVTSALKAMEQQNYGQAMEILQLGQQETEEIYMAAAD